MPRFNPPPRGHQLPLLPGDRDRLTQEEIIDLIESGEVGWGPDRNDRGDGRGRTRAITPSGGRGSSRSQKEPPHPVREYLRRRQVLSLVAQRLSALMEANERMRGRGRDPFAGPEHPAMPPERVPKPFGGPGRPSGPGMVPDPFGGPTMPSGPGAFDPGPRAPVLPPQDFPRNPSLPPGWAVAADAGYGESRPRFIHQLPGSGLEFFEDGSWYAPRGFVRPE